MATNDRADQLAIIKKQQQYALQLEEKKWQLKKDELSFLEAGQHMRSLNQLMWQVPTMAIAVTGGLWYGAATIDADAARSWVFGFASIVDFLTIITLLRLRDIIGHEMNIQKTLVGGTKPKSIFPGYTVVLCWSIALFTAVVIGIVGACNSEAFKKTKEDPTPRIINTLQVP